MTRSDLIALLDKEKPVKARVTLADRYPKTYLYLSVTFQGDDDEQPEDPTGSGWYTTLHLFNHTRGGMTPKRAAAMKAVREKYQRWVDEWMAARRNA